MAGLHDTLKVHVDNGSVPGAVGLVARGGRMEVAAVGSMAVGGAPMARDSIFRFASITKPITAAAVMMLVDDGLIALDDPVDRWLPELAEPTVVRTPTRPVDDVVAAARPITVFDLLSSQAGYGLARACDCIRLHADSPVLDITGLAIGPPMLGVGEAGPRKGPAWG